VFKRSTALRVCLLLAAVTGSIAVPATASATTLWVSTKAPSAPFNSCEHPGYDHIETALAGPGTAIHVCEGTYAEQLTIERPVTITGYGATTVELPAVTANSNTPCDKASEEASSLADQDAVSVCGAGKVVIKNLAIDAVWPGAPVGEAESCAYNLNGILVAGGSELELSGSTVTGARPKTINGCQYGVGIQIGMSYTSSLGLGVAKLTKDTISGYQKNGITVEGVGSEATISKATVTGAGPIAALAQNGIGVQLGAKATITGSTITADECNNPTCGSNSLASYQSDGVYFYDAAAGSSVGKSIIDSNDVGVEAFDTPTTGPTIKSDTLENNRWEAVSISQGAATITSDAMRYSNIGIQLLQYEKGALGEPGQAYGATGTATHDTIEAMSKIAVLGRSDKGPSDMPGELSITNSKISDNPGPRPLESVESENPTSLKIYAEKDH
jgi:nitrous oxidase accessory protein NosD